MRPIFVVSVLVLSACESAGIPQTPPPGSSDILVELRRGLEECEGLLQSDTPGAAVSLCEKTIQAFDKAPDTSVLPLCDRTTVVKLELSLGRTLYEINNGNNLNKIPVADALLLVDQCALEAEKKQSQ